jgi:acetyl esterase/lipase
MKKTIKIAKQEPMVRLASEIVYGQKAAWGGIARSPLRLSFLWPENHYRETNEKLPLIIWLCGGAFTEVDRNIWIPELTWFAKRGYAVASIDYSTGYRSRFPGLVEDVKLGIRYMKEHAAEYNVNPDRLVLMGESAGGYLSAFCGVTGYQKQFDIGGYENQNSAVKAAICWYPVVRISELPVDPKIITVPVDFKKYADVDAYVTPEAPSILILHGNSDNLVPLSQGEILYEALSRTGTDVELIILEGAGHGDANFVQPEIKGIMLDFIKKSIG